MLCGGGVRHQGCESLWSGMVEKQGGRVSGVEDPHIKVKGGKSGAG